MANSTPFDSDSLVLRMQNERTAIDSILHHVRSLRRLADRWAEQQSRDNAEWHDDPSSDDHADYHASAFAQFPRDVRDEAVIELVRHYLTELTLDEFNRSNPE